MPDNENRAPLSSRASAQIGRSTLTLATMVAFMILGSPSLAGAKPAPTDDGSQTFRANCAICHGADGAGTPTGKSLKVPDLHSPDVQKVTNAQMIAEISDGKNNMPPFKNTLSPDEIKAVVAYVRATFGKK